MLIICTDGQCVNHCLMPIFNESKTFPTLTLARSLRIHSQVIFSRSISNIHSICTIRTLTYRSVRRAITRQASGRPSSSRLCTIRSVTSYTTAICSSVRVTVFALQKYIEYYNLHNLRGYEIISNSIRSFEHWLKMILRKIYTN
jgi:hypothetical protein